ncbi:hypothetical protein KC19_2G025900 [Ceratodon purpureus]|uniref:Uncharacterized protein n=1 Tax=Ceratodon purpureus TaxID=3225 RepID=A0A8T0IPD6_CERPU|nr:hypothetical protein KC19_2G025900 [Ceratodon purpureus]
MVVYIVLGCLEGEVMLVRNLVFFLLCGKVAGVVGTFFYDVSMSGCP